MTMGWMETIRFLGLDLEIATVFAVGSIDVTVGALSAAWRRLPRGALSLGSVRVGGKRLNASPRLNLAAHAADSS